MRPSTVRYRGQQDQFADNNLVPSPAGLIIQCQAALALNIGDVVQYTATLGQVTKLTTNPSRVAGIVVGGQGTPDQGVWEDSGTYASDAASVLAGIPAATAIGQYVFVLVTGIAWVVSDAAIAAATAITMSVTTVGRVAPGVSSATVAAGATPVTSTAANGAIIAGNDFITPVIGKSIDAAVGGAGVAFLAYINIH